MAVDSGSSSGSDLSFDVDEFGQIVENCFDRNKNEVLRNSIRLSHMMDGMEDEVLSMAMKQSIDIFGGFRVLLKELISQCSDNNQLNALYMLLKETHNEYAISPKAPHSNNLGTNPGASPDASPIASPGANPGAITLNTLPSELLSSICGYLERHSLNHLKLVSWSLGVVCLEEMSKIPIAILNADSLLHYHQDSRSMIIFRDINDFRNHQMKRLMDNIRTLKSTKFELDFEGEVDSESNSKSASMSIEQRNGVIAELKLQKQALRDIITTKPRSLLDPSELISERMVLGTTLHDVFARFGTKWHIPMEYQWIYHFRKRAPFDLFGSRNTDTMTNEVQLTDEQYREFIVFDQRKVLHLNSSSNPLNPHKVSTHSTPTTLRKEHCRLVFLKYFDVEHQKLQFVTHLLMDCHVTVRDVIHFVEHQFVPDLCRNNIDNKKQSHYSNTKYLWFDRLQSHLQCMLSDAVSLKLALYRESRSCTERGRYFLNSLLEIGNVLNNGDILIFQLNPLPSYFADSQSDSGNIKMTPQKGERKWYKKVDEYIEDMIYLRLSSPKSCVSVRFQSADATGWGAEDTENMLHYLKHCRGIVTLSQCCRGISDCTV